MIYEKQTHQRDIELRFAGADAVFATDKVLLLRILSNLVSNAIQHAAATRVLVALRSRPGRIVLQVRDNGRGLSAERGAALLENGTEPARAENATYGSGIGLNIVKSLVGRLDGTLELRSAPGLGTCFQVTFPSPELPSGAATVWLDDVDVASRRVIELVCATVGWPLHRLVSATATSAQRGPLLVEAPQLLARTSTTSDFTVALTYDRSAGHREALSACADLVLYQPLDAVQVRAALARYVTTRT
jgi:anti-sigma regulatory factor (Ser/Thr protein kinase)